MSELAASRSADAAQWWRGAVIYQIYPRSFADSNGDGIGDLPGATAKLDHVAALGVDAVWLSPFFTSPMKDFGYDIADYRGVDPIFGKLGDFDAFVARAHALGLKVLIDQVYSHTSDAHAWFRESRADAAGPKADWYVWADAKPDGSPPSNWQSVFGGSAWTWDARRQQYYLHNFLSAQPDLNVHNPDVQDALLDTARFWLARGVDGFRLDAVDFAMHDPALTNNPPAAPGHPRTRPFDFQRRVHNQSHPDIAGFLERLRAVLDEYPGSFTVAEVGGTDSAREQRAYTAAGRLDSAYGFDFLYGARLTPALVAHAAARWPDDEAGAGWPSWAFSNHDAARAVSRWAAPAERDACARVAMLLLLTLRGNAIVYQGEELGLPQVAIGFDDLRDPEAIANWPLTLGRDGARTPMPWAVGAAGLGFTAAARPWLPLGADHAALAVDAQEDDPASMLELTRRLIALRRAYPALRLGACRVIEAGASVLAFERAHNGERLLCVFNFAVDPAEWRPTDAAGWQIIQEVGAIDGWRLGGWAGLVAQWSA